MKNYKIAVAGTGYVGLSLGVLFAQHHQVVAVDIVQAKVDMINNKKSPIQDDYIQGLRTKLKQCCQDLQLFLCVMKIVLILLGNCSVTLRKFIWIQF